MAANKMTPFNLSQAEECRLKITDVCDEKLMNLVSAYGEYLGVTQEFILFPLLSCVSALMGKSSCEISECWEEPCTLWTVVGSQSGTRKSAVIDNFSNNLNQAWDTLSKEADADEYPKTLPLILEPINVKSYDKCGTFGLALPEDTKYFVTNFQEKGDLRLKRLYDSSYNPKYKWERMLCIGGFIHHEDVESFLCGEEFDINYRFLVTCPPRALYRFISLKPSLAPDDIKISELLLTVGRFHIAEKFYCMSDETKTYFGELCDEFTMAMESTTDEEICNILSKSHGQLIRVACVLACAKQALTIIHDKYEKIAKEEADKAAKVPVKVGKKRGPKPKKGNTPNKKSKKIKPDSDTSNDTDDPEFTANIKSDVESAASERPTRNVTPKSYDFEDLLYDSGLIDDNGADVDGVLDKLHSMENGDKENDANGSAHADKIDDVMDYDWSTEIQKEDLKAAYTLVKHCVCVRLALLDLTLYGFREQKPTPVKVPKVKTPNKPVRQKSTDDVMVVSQKPPQGVMVTQQQQAPARSIQVQSQVRPQGQRQQQLIQGQRVAQRQAAPGQMIQQRQNVVQQKQYVQQNGQLVGRPRMSVQQNNNSSPRQRAPQQYANVSPGVSPRQVQVQNQQQFRSMPPTQMRQRIFQQHSQQQYQ